MTNPFVTRNLLREGIGYVLYVEQPVNDEDGAWSTQVGLLRGREECWSHNVYGYDGLQSLLLSLSLAKRLLESEGGFTVGDSDDLMFPDIPDN
ncbi:hypothetical protein CRD60_05975 [Bifidobacterium aemilianum]|uniref:Uncharacterized protein n=1 Tax=Bifidobacterium aemilianum TaxID=2493120 RepID=A0A366K8G8_9BIFI|nr:hypothetical protein [Bifidobacterium aemilianum]RBP97542.1 hypothetical protein CRD60_05975 [Bifidobacterium aemilianum]